jgi:hypothetical protein
MLWRHHRPCDHPDPREVVVQVVITDGAGNVRAVREAVTWISCEHWRVEDDGAVD